MKDRIKQIRETLRNEKGKKLSQKEFGARMGFSDGYISTLESGEKPIGDRVVLAVCRTYNVSERWLRTGEGEMFRVPDETEADLEAFRRVLKAKIKRLPPEGQAVVLELCLELQNAIGGIEDKKNETETETYADGSDGESTGVGFAGGQSRKVA